MEDRRKLTVVEGRKVPVFAERSCKLCGSAYIPKAGSQKYCPRCGKILARYRKYRKPECMKRAAAAIRKPEAKRYGYDMSYCRGCVHWRCIGTSDCSRCCHYILDTGHKRGCPPGAGCIRRETVSK